MAGELFCGQAVVVYGRWRGSFNRCHGGWGSLGYVKEHSGGSIIMNYVKNVTVNNTSFSNETLLDMVSDRSI